MAENGSSAYQRMRPASDASPLKSSPKSPRNQAGKSLALSKTEKSVTVSDASRHRSDRSFRTSWDPWFLSWTVLAGFILLFLLMITSLEVLAWYSNTHNGLATSDSRKHYLWTYGPTAVLVAVAALWRQVDYRAKEIMPWAGMARGPTNPEKSLLLDYVSPMQVVSLWSAAKHRHWVIILTISVFISIKALTVISTGLLVLESTMIHGNPTMLTANTTFDTTSFGNGSKVDSGPKYAVYGHHAYNLPYPAGTTEEYAFQSITTPEDSSVQSTALLNATVDYFAADMDCEVGAVGYTNSTDWDVKKRSWDPAPGEQRPESQYYNTTILTPDCRVIDAYTDAPFPPDSADKPMFGWMGMIATVNCSNLVEAADSSQRLFISVVYSERIGDGNRIVNATALLCKPHYEIGRAIIVQNRTTSTQGIDITPISGSSRQLPGLSSWDIAFGVWNSLTYFYAASSQSPATPPSMAKGGSSPGSDGRSVFTYGDEFFGLMMTANPNISLAAYMDSQRLISDSRQIFRSLSSQLAHQYLLSPVQITLEGSYSGFFNRILVQEVPLRVMEGLLASLALATLVLGFIVPRRVLPRSVDSLGGLAAILVRSSRLLRPLQATGRQSMIRLRQILEFYEFHTSMEEHDNVPNMPAFRIVPQVKIGSSRQSYKQSHWERPRSKWWRPIAFSLPMMCLTIAVPLLMIATLEILVQFSLRHQGLADVDPNSSSRYAWLHVPTLLFMSIATLTNMLDFEMETFQPYIALQGRSVPAKTSILYNPLGKVTFLALWDAVRFRQLAVTATATAAMFAPFLTIVSSGLYTVQKIPFSQVVPAQQIDWFDHADDRMQYSNGSYGLILGLVTDQNMTYPKWTYNELAIPQFDIDFRQITVPGAHQLTVESTINLQTSALRGALNCTAHPVIQVNESGSGPCTWCNGATRDSDITSFMFSLDVNTPNCTPSDGLVAGEQHPATVLDPAPTGPGVTGDIAILSYLMGQSESDAVSNSRRSYCDRSFTMLLAHVEHNKTNYIDAIWCTPYTQQVTVNATFNLPNYSISLDTPPKALEDTAKFFSEDSWYPDGLQGMQTGNDNLSPFFQTLIYGKDGIPFKELSANRSRLIEASEHLYRQYAAQALNIAYRIPVSLPNSTEANINHTMPATLVYPDRSRLVQSVIATRTLEGLLAILFICAVIAYTDLLIRTDGTRRILPKIPTTIASVASLMADSEMLSDKIIPPGTEFMSNGEMRRRGVFEGWMFSLGWWNGRTRFAIDVGKAETEEKGGVDFDGRLKDFNEQS